MNCLNKCIYKRETFSDQNTKRESGRKVQLQNINAGKVSKTKTKAKGEEEDGY